MENLLVSKIKEIEEQRHNEAIKIIENFVWVLYGNVFFLECSEIREENLFLNKQDRPRGNNRHRL